MTKRIGVFYPTKKGWGNQYKGRCDFCEWTLTGKRVYLEEALRHHVYVAHGLRVSVA